MDPAGLALFGTALQTLSSVLGLAKDVNKVELTQKLIEFQGQLLKIQAEMALQQQTILELQAENKDLKSLADIRSRREFDGVSYWVKEQDGDKFDGPFCQACWDSDNKIIRLVHVVGNFGYSKEKYEYRFDCQVHEGSNIIEERVMAPYLNRLIRPIHK